MFDICYLDPHTVPIFKMPEIKLTYFNIEGKAELIRILLHAGNFDFEDFRVSSPRIQPYLPSMDSNAFQVRSSRIPLPETLPDDTPLWPGDLKSATTFGQV